MKYWQAKKLPSTKFKRMTGVKKNICCHGSPGKISGKTKKETGSTYELNC